MQSRAIQGACLTPQRTDQALWTTCVMQLVNITMHCMVFYGSGSLDDIPKKTQTPVLVVVYKETTTSTVFDAYIGERASERFLLTLLQYWPLALTELQ